MKPAPIQIAVVGHTNTGKTSLLRTLTRDIAFGEVSDRPATTRDVEGAVLLADGAPVATLYDTPGIEDAIGVSAFLAQRFAGQPDPVAGIESFLAGDHDRGRYEQEAKILRQVLRSDAALYVIDAREPVLAKHREELRLLAACGRPVLPVLNFVVSAEADGAAWKSQLARMGLHVLAEFDTVVFDARAERVMFEKLGVLLEPRRAELARLLQARAAQRDELIAAACRAVAELLVNAAGLRVRADLATAAEIPAARLHDTVRQAEQACVDALLGLFRFELTAYRPPELPLDRGRWELDPFDPEALRRFGVRAGSAAAAGGVAGITVDAMTGFMSLGAAAALGAGLGAAWSASQTFAQPWLDRVRGHQELAASEATLALLAARQVLLLNALLRRGHASSDPVAPKPASGWPSRAVRDATLRCRVHPEWSALNSEAEDPLSQRAVAPVAAALRLSAASH